MLGDFADLYRLSDNARAREALRQCLPEPLRDATFSSVLRDDAATKRCLAQLLINLSDNMVESNNHQVCSRSLYNKMLRLFTSTTNTDMLAGSLNID